MPLPCTGDPNLAANFTHFPYVNPKAPKGGALTLGATGTFDNLNPFIIKGVAPTGIRGYIYESLLARSADEPFTLYGLVAERLEVPDDRSSITFHLNPKARFADGRALTTADVAFSHDLLRRKGRPYMRSHYGKVAKVEVLGAADHPFRVRRRRRPRDSLDHGPHADPAQSMPSTRRPSSRRPWRHRSEAGPIPSRKVVPGHSVTFTRNADYWGRDLPSRRGLFNFDQIRLDYFRNSSALFEAFKAGNVDYRPESDPARWIDSYDFPAIQSGKIRETYLRIRVAGRDDRLRLQHQAAEVRRSTGAPRVRSGLRCRSYQSADVSWPLHPLGELLCPLLTWQPAAGRQAQPSVTCSVRTWLP